MLVMVSIVLGDVTVAFIHLHCIGGVGVHAGNPVEAASDF